jgi:hypothetical protein
MPIESRAVCAKSLTPQKSGHQRKTDHSLIQNGPRMMERGQCPPGAGIKTLVSNFIQNERILPESSHI